SGRGEGSGFRGSWGTAWPDSRRSHRLRRGVAVTSLEWALVDSWPMLVADAQRAPLLCAVGERLTTTARVRDAVRARYRLPQRAALLRLLDRLDAGCRSPLELRDYDHVFTGPGFEQLRW